jgi:pseudaminic acid synthase
MIHIVAEISGNHGGLLDRALRLMDLAAESGATMIKFQMFDPDNLAIKRATNMRLSQYGVDHLRKIYYQTYTPMCWFPKLDKKARELRLPWFTSIFDPAHALPLRDMGAWGVKVASFELGDDALLEAIAETEMRAVISAHADARNDRISKSLGILHHDAILLHATDYGVPFANARMDRFRTISNFTPHIGLSDHTYDLKAAMVATAWGASMIEKHIIDPDMPPTPDHAFSATPLEFASMADVCKQIYEIRQIYNIREIHND